MGVFDFTVIPILDDPHPPSSPSSKSCHNMMEKGLKSSLILVKETNKKKERISSKATSSAAASMKFCVCAPPTHPDSFKCRLHRATASAHPRTVSSSTSKMICLCAPATHPGSFKCRLHRATTSSHTGKYFCYEKMVCEKKKEKRFNFSCSHKPCVFFSFLFFAVSSSAHHINGVKGTKNLNALKLVTSSQSGGVRNSSKGNVHGKPKLSRFGRAALVHAAAAATSSVLIQPISAEFGQMSLS